MDKRKFCAMYAGSKRNKMPVNMQCTSLKYVYCNRIYVSLINRKNKLSTISLSTFSGNRSTDGAAIERFPDFLGCTDLGFY